MKEVVIAGRRVGPGSPPLIIAEMSGNHNGSLQRALEIVDAAAQAGAHAIKLQTYTADSMTLDVHTGEFYISDEKSLWHGQSLYELYTAAATPWEWHEPIFRRCRELGLVAFSTPFGEDAVEFLESLSVPCYKIASFEIVHLPLIRRVARTGKPMIISTGMASTSDIDEAVKTARDAGCCDIVLMKCTSTYPASAAYTNIRTIPHLYDMFGAPVGLSDHTLGIGVAVASVALGAAAIEKHVTLRRADGGVDSAFSLEPPELKALVEEAHRAWEALGQVIYGPTEPERASMVYRRSLYIGQEMKAGEPLTVNNLRIVRPGMGLPPRFYEALLGKHVVRDVTKGTPVSWDLID